MDYSSDFQHRYVEFTEDAKIAIKDLEKQVPRLNAILTAIHIFLQENAHRGKHIRGPLYLYVSKKLPDAGAIECYYSFDDKYVRIYDLCIAEVNNSH